MIAMFRITAAATMLAVAFTTVGFAQSEDGLNSYHYVTALEEPTETYKFLCAGYNEGKEPLSIRAYDAEQPREIELQVSPDTVQLWILRPMIIRVTECATLGGNGVLEKGQDDDFATFPDLPENNLEPLRIDVIHRAGSFNMNFLPKIVVHRAVYREARKVGQNVHLLSGRIAGVLGDMAGLGLSKLKQQQTFRNFKANPSSFLLADQEQLWLRLSGSEVATLALCDGQCGLRVGPAERRRVHNSVANSSSLGARTSGVQYVDEQLIAVDNKALEKLVVGRCDDLHEFKIAGTLDNLSDERMQPPSLELFSSEQGASCAVGKLEGLWSNVVVLFFDEPINLIWREPTFLPEARTMNIAAPNSASARFEVSFRLLNSDDQQVGKLLNEAITSGTSWIVSSDILSALTSGGEDGSYACEVANIDRLLVTELIEDCVFVRDGRADFAPDLTVSLSPRTIFRVRPIDQLNPAQTISNEFVELAIVVDGSSVEISYDTNKRFFSGVIDRNFEDVSNADITCELKSRFPYQNSSCIAAPTLVTNTIIRPVRAVIPRAIIPFEIDLRVGPELITYQDTLKFELPRVELVLADGGRQGVPVAVEMGEESVLRIDAGPALRSGESLVIKMAVSSDYAALEGDYSIHLDGNRIQQAMREGRKLLANIIPPRQIVDPSKYRIRVRSLADGELINGSVLKCGLQVLDDNFELEAMNEEGSGSFILRSRDGGPVAADLVKLLVIGPERPDQTGCRVSGGSQLGEYDPSTSTEHTIDIDRTNPIVAFIVSRDGRREYVSELFPRAEDEDLFWDRALLGTMYELFSAATQQETPLKARQVYVEKSVPTLNASENILRLGPLPEGALSVEAKRTIESYVLAEDYASLMDPKILIDRMEKHRRANTSPSAEQSRSEGALPGVSPVIAVHFSVEKQTGSACRYLDLVELDLIQTRADHLIYIPLVDDEADEPYPDCLNRLRERILVTPIRRFEDERRNYNEVSASAKIDFNSVMMRLRQLLRHGG